VKKDMELDPQWTGWFAVMWALVKQKWPYGRLLKPACDGKQAAVLVPTTILAFQHYKTFSDRLKDFPVTVDYINRFKSAKEKKDTLKRLEEGRSIS
jgi:transcription-repair coupling factor (superfamily II helicase)